MSAKKTYFPRPYAGRRRWRFENHFSDKLSKRALLALPTCRFAAIISKYAAEALQMYQRRELGKPIRIRVVAASCHLSGRCAACQQCVMRLCSALSREKAAVLRRGAANSSPEYIDQAQASSGGVAVAVIKEAKSRRARRRPRFYISFMLSRHEAIPA